MTFFLWVILVATFLNLLGALRFYYFIRGASADELPVEEQNDAVVILSIRGSDPTLEKTLSGLLKQNFQDYRIVAVVDSPQDPAWKLLQRIKYESDAHHRLTIQPMDPPRSTCSLKCSAIAGAIESLPMSTRWVAFVDADVEVYPNWLSDLLGPLMNSRVCVSTGNQWFEPSVNSAGSIIRSIWNAGAIVPSVLLSHPWAGSMGVRYEDVIVSSLIEDWKQSVVDDGPMMEFASQMDGQIVVNPKLLMVNREDCSRTFAVDWISRMLTWSRIYESTFWMTVVHASISGGLVIVLALWILAALVAFDFWSLGLAILTTVLGAGMLTAGYWIVRRAVSVSLQRRQLPALKKSSPKGVLDFVKIGMWMGPVLIFYLYGCFKAQQPRSIFWRGIEYRFDGKKVEMAGYRPFESGQAKDVGKSI